MKSKIIISLLGIPLFGAGYYHYQGLKPLPIKYNQLDFQVKVDYCDGCGFRPSAELFSMKVKEIYPRANFILNPVDDEPGALEIFVKMENEEEKLIHSALKGDGKIYRKNVNKIVQKLDDFVQKK